HREVQPRRDDLRPRRRPGHGRRAGRLHLRDDPTGACSAMMLSDFPLWPEQASSVAGNVDALFIFMCVVTGGVSLLIFVLIFALVIKYRRRPANELDEETEPPGWLEAEGLIISFSIVTE